MTKDDSRATWRERAAVGVVALIASLSGLLNNFAHDDVSLILDNARAHGSATLASMFTSSYWPSPFPHELYRPIVSLLMMIEYVAGSGSPMTFRIVSYVLYAAASLGVFALASRILPKRIALAIALLFAAHPVHVEAVALGVNQAELIVGLVSMVMVARYVDVRRTGDGTIAARDWALFAALYTLAALTKESGFVLPALLIAAELVIANQQTLRQRALALWTGYGVLAALGGALLLVRRAVLAGDMVGTFTAEALLHSSAGNRALTMLQVVPKWLRLLAWPAHLQIDYSPNEIVASTHFGVHEALGALVLVGAIVVAITARRRAPVVSFGLAWCAITLLPVANIVVPSSIVLAERTLFVPSIGFVIAVGGAIEWVMRSLRFELRRESAFAVGLLVVLGVGRSVQRHTVWRNDAHLWMVAGVDAPRSYRVARAQGDARFALGDIAGAMQQYNYAIAASPKPWRIRYDLALRLRDAGLDTAALAQLQLSLAEQKPQRDVTAELALAQLAVGRYRDARETASWIAAGDTVRLFREIETVADSAMAIDAPPGSVQIKAHVVVDN